MQFLPCSGRVVMAVEATMILDRTFNQVVLAMAPRFEARPCAPETFVELHSAPGIVWDGASERTIYGDERVNHAARAWHDHCHLLGRFDFTLEGERATAELQKRQIMLAYPRAPLRWLRLIDAEVIEQANHLAMTGSFVSDQVAFVRQYLEANRV